ncbi:MAG: FtsH protease activity modulator HflK [Gammaproteobacteria bacterium]
MAWNEPGGGGNGGKNPWGGGGNQGPPDLDELVRNLKNKLGSILGGSGRGGSGGGSGPGRIGSIGLGLIVSIIAVVWLLSGIYIIDEGKRGVELRFGKYLDTTMPGPHWHIPYPIDQVEVVDVEQRRFVEIGYRSSGGRNNSPVVVPRESLMLTKDENIVSIQLAVQYQVKDARQYLFNVRNPDLTLKQVAESALRDVVGKRTMDFVLTQGRADVVATTKVLMQTILDQYDTGLIVSDVNLQDAQPPEEVQGAFADAIKAREDEVRQKNEAEAYAFDIIPKARGAAARQTEEADAYRASIIAQAEGEASRFQQLLTEYEKAPEVTRKRLYLETMESVFSRTSKITVDLSSGNSLMYIPLDKLMERQGGGGAGVRDPRSSVPGASAVPRRVDPVRAPRTTREGR